MIPCPKCNRETEVIVERIALQYVEFEWKSKGKGIKKKVLTKSEKSKPEVDRRLRITCKYCSFESNNLSSQGDYGLLNSYKEEIELIEEQLDNISF